MRFFRQIAPVAVLFLLFPLSGWGKDTKFSLKNGMSVVIEENHASPIVAVQVWVKAGSTTEPEEYAGISHVLEHMAFKGTNKRGIGEIAREVESLGGNINAYTSYDHTVYHITISSTYVENALDILADTLANSIFDEGELKKEVEVVMEEYRMNQDNPSRVARRTLFSDFFSVHPYGRPILGTPETLKNIDRDAILSYFQRYYFPGNMVLVITGDISADKLRPAIDRYMGALSGDGEAVASKPEEPVKRGVSLTLTRMEAKRAYINIAFPGVSMASEDLFAYDLLGQILGGGETSRLYSRLKDDLGIVDYIYAYSFTPKDPGTMLIGATCDPEKVPEVISAILEEVYDAASRGVSREENERARNNTVADFIYKLESQEELARYLGFFETSIGDAFFEKRYIDKVRRVTGEEIRAVGKQYFKEDNFAVSVVVPKDYEIDIDGKSVSDLASEKYREAFKEKKVEDMKITEDTLPNGIRLVIRENHYVPVVAASIGFLGGVRAENRETNGASNLMASLLTRGTKKHSAKELSEMIESMAGRIGPFSGRNSLGLNGKFLSEDFEKGIRIMSGMILSPTFDVEEIGKKKKEILAAIKSKEDRPIQEVIKLYLKSQYGDHPYSLDPLGTLKSVTSITRQMIVDFYNRLVTPGNMIIVISGDVDRADARNVISSYFEDFSREGDGGKLAKKIDVSPPEKAVKTELKREKLQAHFIVGFLGTTFEDKDRYPLDILSAALAGQGGRLFGELRDKKSLAYSLTAFSSEQYDRGFLAFYMGTAGNKLDESIQAMKEEIAGFLEGGITSEELSRAKNYLVGSFERGLQSNSAYAESLMFNVLYGNGIEGFLSYPEKIREVSADGVLAAGRKYIEMDRYVLAVITP